MKRKKLFRLGLLLCVTLPDQTEADLIQTGVTYDASGNLVINAQKVLKDKDTGEQVNDGPALQFTESAGGANATAIGAAVDTAMLNLYNAQKAAAAGGTDGAKTS